MSQKTFYLTTPIYYVNGAPHIGHIFTTTLVETLANWSKNRGIKTIYSSGVDEHGIKVETTAKSKGFEPKAWCDKTTQEFHAAFDNFDIHPDLFIRTSSEKHYEIATQFWNLLQKNGYIYKGTYEGWYSKTEECFVPDTQVKTENDKHYNVADGAELFYHSEENYMFALSKMEEALLAYYKENPNFITPKVYFNQVIQMVEQGLKDISISRQNVSWGIPVPNDPKQTMYVWIEALCSYLTGADWPTSQEMWPCDLHTVGKDILKFHAIFWPAFLIAAQVPVYKRLLVHGWWTRDDTKMSKSIGNTLDPLVLCNFWGVEPIKYFLLSQATLVSDADYNDEAMLSKYNNDLADVLGNLVLRATSTKILINSEVPKPNEYQDIDKQLIDSLTPLPEAFDNYMSFGQTKVVLEKIWDRFREVNKYFTTSEPWALKKNNLERYSTVIYVILESIRFLSVCLQAFLPQTSRAILNGLGYDLKNEPKIAFTFGVLQQGTKINQIGVLFPKKQVEFEKKE